MFDSIILLETGKKVLIVYLSGRVTFVQMEPSFHQHDLCPTNRPENQEGLVAGSSARGKVGNVGIRHFNSGLFDEIIHHSCKQNGVENIFTLWYV